MLFFEFSHQLNYYSKLPEGARSTEIFATNEFNKVMNLLTSAALVLNSQDKTDWPDSNTPKVHLAKE